MWKKPMYNPGKKSIFAVQQDNTQDNSQDENAGDDDDNVTDEVSNVGDEPLPKICIQNPTEASETKHAADVTVKCQPVPKFKSQQNVTNNSEPNNADLSVKGQVLPKISIQQNFLETESKSTNTVKVLVKKLSGTRIKAEKNEEKNNIEVLLEDNDIKTEKLGHKESTDYALALKNSIGEETVSDSDGFNSNTTEPTLDKQKSSIGKIEMSELYVVKSVDALENDSKPNIDVVDGCFPNVVDTGSAQGGGGDSLGQSEQNKTKIAWVNLGTCPVCQTDLTSFHASEPCHKTVASEKNSLVLEEIENDINVGKQIRVSEETLDIETPLGQEKTNKLQQNIAEFQDITKATVTTNGEGKQSSHGIAVEVNTSNNALPKRGTDSTDDSRTGTPVYSNLPCDECHDVQPSESSCETTLSAQKPEEDKKAESRSESRSESSGAC